MRCAFALRRLTTVAAPGRVESNYEFFADPKRYGKPATDAMTYDGD